MQKTQGAIESCQMCQYPTITIISPTKITDTKDIASPSTPVYSVSCSALNLDAMDGLGEKSGKTNVH